MTEGAGDLSAIGDLVGPLIEGMVEDPLWSTFLARLRERLRADYVSIVFRPHPLGAERRRVLHLYAGEPWPEQINAIYRQNDRRPDPMPYGEMEDGRVYALGELLRVGDPEHDDYRVRFLSAGGMNVLRMLRVVTAEGVSAWITVSRRVGEFGPADEAMLAGLAPYFRAAVRSYVALESERLNGSLAREAIRRLHFGWITLDAKGRVLDSDGEGSRLLAEGDVLRRGAEDRLGVRDKEVAREIAVSVAELVGKPQTRPRAIVLRREPWLDMLLVAAPNRDAAPTTTRQPPALVAYVHGDSWSSADRCEQLGELFDLLPSEARLALALSRGASITEAAGDLGLSVESARTYSKRIYAKTGARGQADLVRFIHRSVLAIA
jgi:DNA-binding CsgD family transcriptional regulator